MATGYEVYCPSTEFSAYSGQWLGNITTWAWEYKDKVKVTIKFYTTQKQVNSKVQGTDYFYGSAVINGKSYDFQIAYLGYPGVNSSYTFLQEVDIPFDSNGQADLSFAVTVRGAAGTYLQGYSISGSLSHTFRNDAKAGTLELSPSAKKMGDTATLAVRGAEGTVRFVIGYEFGGLTGIIAEKQMIAEDASLLDLQWVIPDLLEGCPNAAGGLLTITCETYRFDTLLGTSQVQRQISAFPAATLTAKGSNIKIGYAYDFTTVSSSDRYSTTLRYRLLGHEGIIWEDSREAAYTWEVPLSMGKLMPATKTETLYLYLDTYHGTALVGTNSYSRQITAIYGDFIPPVIDAVYIRRYAPDAPDQFQGILLQNASKVDIRVDAHSDTSEPASYQFVGFGTEIAIDAQDFGGFQGLTVNAPSGNHTIGISVTDRRGNKDTNYYTLKILPYQKPKVIPYAVDDVRYSAPVCYRADREGMASGSGSFLRIMAGRMFSEVLSDGVNINGASFSYRIRKTGESWPEEFTQLLSFEEPENFVSRNLENSFPDPDSSYQVELQVKDLVGFTHSYLAKVSSQKVNFSLLCAADGAAFGKTAEYPGVVEIAQDMTLWVRGGLKVDGASWQELEAVSSDNIWESGYAHGQRPVSGCFYRSEHGSKILVAFNRAIRWLGNPITVNAVPIPQADCPVSPVSAICPADNGFVLATVGTDGYITIDLAWNPQSTSQYNWVDGFIQYWKEEI